MDAAYRSSRLDVAEPGLYFCPDGNVAKLIGRKDLSKKKQAIQNLHKLDKRWNAVIPLFLALWLSSASMALSTESLVVKVVAYLISGLALSTLAVLAHESVHNLFTHNPKIDRWIGFLCSIPILLSPTGYRLRHPLHHKNVRNQGDPDDIENISRNSNLLTTLHLVMLFFGVYLFLVDVPMKSYRQAPSSVRFRILVEILAILSVHALAWAIFPTRVMIGGWLIPLLVAVQIANIRGMAEHGLTSSGNEFIDTRTVRCNPVLSFLMCHVNYHLEHHLFPGVPWYNLPKLHCVLKEEFLLAGSSVYTSYSSFLYDALKVLRAGVFPRNRLIPRQVRDRVCL